jgi:hypothetical protein
MGAATGDFDGDGDVDVVGVGFRLGASGSGTPSDLPRQAGVISLFRNDGSGSFQPPDTATGTGLSFYPEFATPGASAATVSVADLNLDGRIDVAVASQRRFDPQNPVRIVVFAGNGAGEFARIGEAPCWVEVPGNPLPQPVVLRDAVPVDVDADGRRDIALLVDQGGTSFLRVFRIGTTGRPERREGYAVAAQLGIPTSIATGGNLLGQAHQEVVIGGDPSGTSVQVEVRRD